MISPNNQSQQFLFVMHGEFVACKIRTSILCFRFHFRRTIRNSMDLREHKVFHSDPQLDCCPTVAEQVTRYKGINPQGIMLELFTFQNFTQTFYEVHCHPAIKSGQCRYIDPRIAHASRCIQQYSYVYSIARTYGAYDEGFRLERIRVASGCKCSIVREYIGKRRRRDIQWRHDSFSRTEVPLR